MKLNDRISPASVMPWMDQKDGLAIVRERILQAFLLGILAIGLFAVAAVVLTDLGEAKTGLATLYIGVYVWVLTVTLWRELPYRLRAGTVITICYILAVVQLLDHSLLGEVRFWLITFTTVTALLFGLAPALVSAALGVLTIAAMGLLLDFQLVSLPTAANFYLGSSWIVSSLALALAAIGIALASTGLVRGLQELLVEKETQVKDLNVQRTALDTQLQNSASDSQRRLIQVRTAAKISNAISRLSNPATLYQEVVELVHEELQLYYVGLFLVDELNRYAVLRAGTGEPGRVMLERGHRLAIGGSSMIGSCISNRAPRIALDVGKEAVRFNNPLLPQTRSELALPIISRDTIVGALTVQSSLSQAFDDNDIINLQGIADSLASAIENTRLVTELRQNLDELRSLNQNYLREAWANVSQDKGPVSFTYESTAGTKENLKAIEIPVMLRDQMIAWLTLDATEAKLSPEDASLLEALTTQTALALENARLVQETERRVVQEHKLNDLSTRFSRSFDIETILKTAVEELGRLPQVTEASVELVPSDLESSPGHEHFEAGGNGKGKTG